MSSAQKAAIASSLSHLSLDSNKKASKPVKKSKKPVADSWEDEDVTSESDSDEAAPDRGSNALPSAPPPTPISPTYKSDSPWSPMTDVTSAFGSNGPDSTGSRRPEKTDAVARRMIASALGVKAPKQTEEQRAYDRAIREQEKKRRDEERATERKRQEEAEKAKSAMWDD
jgi:hypothetical protein